MTEKTAERFASLLISNNAAQQDFEVELDDYDDMTLVAKSLRRKDCRVDIHPVRALMTVHVPSRPMEWKRAD